MTYAEVKAYINEWIITNGNREITAAVLNPVLQSILDWANSIIGNLASLNTTDKSNLVNAINEVKNDLDNIDVNGSQVLYGLTNPNETPPADFGAGDFYLQEDLFNNPIALFVFDGFIWQNISNNFNRKVKLISGSAPYILQETDSVLFLTLTTEYNAVLPLELSDGIEFWIKNTSGSQREVTFDVNIVFEGSPLIPDNGLCILKKLYTSGVVETWSVNVISESGGGSSVWGGITGDIEDQEDLIHYFIPRLGTIKDYPINGDFEVAYALFFHSVDDFDYELEFDGNLFLKVIDTVNDYTTAFGINMNAIPNCVALSSNNPDFKGIEGQEDYSANYTDNSFVQKSFVIPLSGTEVGSPITGDLEFDFDSGLGIISKISDVEFGFIISDSPVIKYINSLIQNYASLKQDYLELYSTNENFSGILGNSDFSENLTDLSYPQKIYVDTKTSKGVVDNVTTAIISSATLNTDYPDAKTGFKVYATAIIGGAVVYEKINDATEWINYSAMVTP